MAKGEFISIDLDGPMFSRGVEKRFNDALADGLVDLGELGADILTQHVAAAGFIDTGAFIGSIGVEQKRERGAGYVVIRPTAVYPKAGRPTRIWLERGTRGGRKLRPAKNPVAKTKTRLRRTPIGPFFERRIDRVLN